MDESNFPMLIFIYDSEDREAWRTAWSKDLADKLRKKSTILEDWGSWNDLTVKIQFPDRLADSSKWNETPSHLFKQAAGRQFQFRQKHLRKRFKEDPKGLKKEWTYWLMNPSILISCALTIETISEPS